jgi:ABC-type polar amino acid transport system ATPase subunit
MSYLRIQNLNKSFDQKPVLKDVSFEVDQGKTLVIIGNSGSGKTTLLRILSFLESQDNGIITLEGETLSGDRKLTREEISRRRKNFGLVFQSFNLFPQDTVLENILMPLRLSLKKEAKAETKDLPFSRRRKEAKRLYEWKLKTATDRVMSLLEKMKLTALKDSYPGELSGGESQRTAIVRALALNPKILLFDEPTSSLDPKLKNEVARTILALKAEAVTMIVVTHEMEFAQLVADQVVYLEEGQVMEKGDPTILTSPKTKELADFLSLKEQLVYERQTESPDKRRAERALRGVDCD